MLTIASLVFYLLVAIRAYPLSESEQSCPDDLKLLNKNCYYFSPTGDSEKKNWIYADQYCKSRNMQLLSIESGEESEAINNYILTKNRESEEFWTSGSLDVTTGKYKWTGIQKPLTYLHWCSIHPTNYKNNNCIRISWEDIKSRCWANSGCSNNKYNFICESTSKHISITDNSPEKTTNMTVNIYVQGNLYQLNKFV